MLNCRVRTPILLALLFFSPVLLAAEKFDAAYKRLSNVRTFAFGGVGYAGQQSKGEEDFKIVISQSPAVALATFERLYATTNPQAKSYALAGIKRLNLVRFNQLLVDAKKSSENVEVQRGCIISHEPLGDIAQQIADDKFPSKFE